MSQPLRESISTNVTDLAEIMHTVNAAGLDFGFAEEQLSFQIEALISELREQVDSSLKLAETED